jgi:hypothetical protein
MAIFERMPDDFIRKNFKYKALAFGFIPVYMTDPDCGAPMVSVRNWIPEWPLDVMNFLYNQFLAVADPYGLQDRPYYFTITGTIK